MNFTEKGREISPNLRQRSRSWPPIVRRHLVLDHSEGSTLGKIREDKRETPEGRSPNRSQLSIKRMG
jgi:hypothetical protein